MNALTAFVCGLVFGTGLVISGMADRVVTLSDGRIASIRRNEHKTPAAELQW